MYYKVINSPDLFSKAGLLSEKSRATYWDDLVVLEQFASLQLFETTYINIKKNIRISNRRLDSQTKALFKSLKNLKEQLRNASYKSPPNNDQTDAYHRHKSQLNYYRLKLTELNIKLKRSRQEISPPKNRLLHPLFLLRKFLQKIRNNYYKTDYDYCLLQYQALAEQLLIHKKHVLAYEDYSNKLKLYGSFPQKRRDLQTQIQNKLDETIKNILADCYKAIEQEENPVTIAPENIVPTKTINNFSEANSWQDIKADTPYPLKYSDHEALIYIQFSEKLLNELKKHDDKITQKRLLLSAQRGFAASKKKNGITRLGANKANYKFEIKILSSEDRILGKESQFSGKQLLIFDWLTNTHLLTTIKKLN